MLTAVKKHWKNSYNRNFSPNFSESLFLTSLVIPQLTCTIELSFVVCDVYFSNARIDTFLLCVALNNGLGVLAECSRYSKIWFDFLVGFLEQRAKSIQHMSQVDLINTIYKEI
jgi:hypothetical protein